MDASRQSKRFVGANGQVRDEGPESGNGLVSVEQNPLGQNTGLMMHTPEVDLPEPVFPYVQESNETMTRPSTTCYVDGVESPGGCNGRMFRYLLRSGAGYVKSVIGNSSLDTSGTIITTHTSTVWSSIFRSRAVEPAGRKIFGRF